MKEYLTKKVIFKTDENALPVGAVIDISITHSGEDSQQFRKGIIMEVDPLMIKYVYVNPNTGKQEVDFIMVEDVIAPEGMRDSQFESGDRLFTFKILK